MIQINMEVVEHLVVITPLVACRGKPVHKIVGAFQTMRDTAGFGADVTAHTIRYSIATELAARGVPEIEIAIILGHGMPTVEPLGDTCM